MKNHLEKLLTFFVVSLTKEKPALFYVYLLSFFFCLHVKIKGVLVYNCLAIKETSKKVLIFSI